jgi:hypothetical protein
MFNEDTSIFNDYRFVIVMNDIYGDIKTLDNVVHMFKEVYNVDIEFASSHQNSDKVILSIPYPDINATIDENEEGDITRVVPYPFTLAELEDIMDEMEEEADSVEELANRSDAEKRDDYEADKADKEY